MNDWNGNGHYDMGDRYIDYQGANGSLSNGGSSSVSGIGGYIFIGILTLICPTAGILLLVGWFLYWLANGK